MSGPLPHVFYQKTESNERIASLLSSVFFRGIRPLFTPSIRRHPLSLWSLSEDQNAGASKQIPIVLFIGEASCSESTKTIARVLKKSVAESGVLVAEHTTEESAERKALLDNFHPDSSVFIIDIKADMLKADLLQIDELNVAARNRNTNFSCSPSLVLVSKGDSPSTYSPEIHRHLCDPNTTVVSLPERLDAYGDDGPNSLWIARCILKWMQAARQTTGRFSVPMQSRL